MPKMKHILMLSVSLASAACTMPVAAPPTPLVAFSPEETRWARDSGTAAIEGQAFLKTRGGDVKYGAGEIVTLVPNTAQSFDWFTRMTANRGDVPSLDPGLVALMRYTTSGGDGRFRFEALPAGPYLVLTKVTWEVPGTYLGTQGGYIGSAVQAENGKTLNVVITR